MKSSTRSSIILAKIVIIFAASAMLYALAVWPQRLHATGQVRELDKQIWMVSGLNRLKASWFYVDSTTLRAMVQRLGEKALSNEKLAPVAQRDPSWWKRKVLDSLASTCLDSLTAPEYGSLSSEWDLSIVGRTPGSTAKVYVQGHTDREGALWVIDREKDVAQLICRGQALREELSYVIPSPDEGLLALCDSTSASTHGGGGLRIVDCDRGAVATVAWRQRGDYSYEPVAWSAEHPRRLYFCERDQEGVGKRGTRRQRYWVIDIPQHCESQH